MQEWIDELRKDGNIEAAEELEKSVTTGKFT